MMVSPAGGIDIEEVAAESPEKIMKVPIDPLTGILPFQKRVMTSFLSEEKEVAKQIGGVLDGLYEAFMGIDASLAEINPLVKSPDGKVWAIDAKINIDDNGLFRQKGIEDLRDESAEDPGEAEARRTRAGGVGMLRMIAPEPAAAGRGRRVSLQRVSPAVALGRRRPRPW